MMEKGIKKYQTCIYPDKTGFCKKINHRIGGGHSMICHCTDCDYYKGDV